MPPAQVQYLCEDSAPRMLFVEDDEQLDKALEVREQLPSCARSWCSTWRACASWTTPA
jgi:long-subunit acyl-CoA synthetase (AMP-forming)